jgi:hypothetical protein
MRTTTLRSSISSFGPFCSNGSEPRSPAGRRSHAAWTKHAPNPPLARREGDKVLVSIPSIRYKSRAKFRTEKHAGAVRIYTAKCRV